MKTPLETITELVKQATPENFAELLAKVESFEDWEAELRFIKGVSLRVMSAPVASTERNYLHKIVTSKTFANWAKRYSPAINSGQHTPEQREIIERVLDREH